MKITLSPIASDKTTKVSVNGLVLTVDGINIDLSEIPEGGQAEGTKDSPLIGVVTREKVTVKYFYDSSLAEPIQPADISDYIFDLTENEVPCPIIWKEDLNV